MALSRLCVMIYTVCLFLPQWHILQRLCRKISTLLYSYIFVGDFYLFSIQINCRGWFFKVNLDSFEHNNIQNDLVLLFDFELLHHGWSYLEKTHMTLFLDMWIIGKIFSYHNLKLYAELVSKIQQKKSVIGTLGGLPLKSMLELCM